MEKLAELYNAKFDGKLNKSTISRYENGLQEPIFTTVKNFAELFQVTTDYLTDMTNAKTSSYTLPEIKPPSEVDPDQFAFDMYRRLDSDDKAEIRGEMKQMLKSDKYTKKLLSTKDKEKYNAEISKEFFDEVGRDIKRGNVHTK